MADDTGNRPDASDATQTWAADDRAPQETRRDTRWERRQAQRQERHQRRLERREARRYDWQRAGRWNSVAWGLLLILVGAVLLADRITPGLDLGRTWPFLLVGFGLILVVLSLVRGIWDD